MRLTNNTEYFITKSQSVHGLKYDYSQSDYTSSKEKIIIICQEHGPFSQIANHHISGNGCRKCGSSKSGRKVVSTAEFIRKSRQLYLNDFDYSATDYINSKTHVKIICKKHGEFKQRPDNHLSGLGCKSCNKNDRTRKWLRLNRKVISSQQVGI